MPRLLPRPTRGAFRFGSGRASTAVALGAAGTLVAGIVVAGMGAAGADPHLSDIGAWLASDSKSSVSHVNGLTGQVDGRVQLPRGSKAQLEVGEDGKSVLVLDSTSGKVSRIDPAQLTVPQTADFGTPGMQLVTGGGKAWLIDAPNGVVRAIDPVSLAPLGEPVTVEGKPLGRPQADPSGTLWIPVAAKGQLLPFTTQPGTPIKVAEPGGALLLTVASGRPVVTDVVGGNAVVVSGTGIERTVKLPSDLTKGAADKLLTPTRSEGPVVPILASDTGVLTLVDIDTGSVDAVPLKLDGHDFAPPQVLGAKVYVPDRTTGSLVVYNTVQAQFEPQLKVTGVPGPRLEAYVRDGLLWVNDPGSATAAVVNVQGQIHLIGKFQTEPKPGGAAPSGSAVPTPDKSVPEGGVTESAPEPSGTPSAESSATGGKETASASASASDTATPGGDPSGEVPGDGPPGNTDTGPEAPGNSGGNPGGDPGDNGNGKGTGNGRGTPGNPGNPGNPGGNRTPDPVPTPSVPEIPLPTGGGQQPTDKTTPPADTPPPAQTTPPATSASPTTKTPSPTQSSSSPPVMKKPGTPKATSQSGKIYLTFQPASGATPTKYTLNGVVAGMTVTPASVPPKGPFAFTVAGGSCDKEYSFYITAWYPGGYTTSGRSTAVRPCIAPGKPTNLAVASGGAGKATVSWKAPAKTGGASLKYQVSWKAKAAPKSIAAGYAAPDGTSPALLDSAVWASGTGGSEAVFVSDGTAAPDLAAAKAAAPTSGSTTTTGTSATFTVGTGKRTYTFTVTAVNAAGKASATISVTRDFGKAAAASAVTPDPSGPSGTDDSSPSPGRPGDGGGTVANAAAIAPPRRNAVPTM